MVNSFDFKKTMKKKFGINATVIYNPLNKNEIIRKSKYKLKNIFPKKSLKIINIGRYVDQKDQITLLKSLAILRNKIDFYLIFMGRGILKNKLEKYSKLNNLQNKVKFINFKKSLPIYKAS